MTDQDQEQSQTQGQKQEQQRSLLARFLFPNLNTFFLVRLAILALAAWFFFSKICIPARVDGDSMLPTYETGDFLFCWTPAFKNEPPQQGDVVMIAYSGHKVMLLKRVVAVAGDTVQFINGKLHVNDAIIEEPWTSGKCNWNSKPVTVEQGCVFVVGDNRSMPMAEHKHGMVELANIVGKPVRQ